MSDKGHSLSIKWADNLLSKMIIPTKNNAIFVSPQKLKIDQPTIYLFYYSIEY